MPINVEKDDLKTALKKLKARENTLRKIEEISKLGSWEVDFTNDTATWSKRSYEIYGYEPGEITPNSKTFFEHVLPEYIQKTYQLLERLKKTKEVGNLIAKLRRKDGKIIDVVLSGQFIEDEDGHLKLLGTTQDITEYVQLQRETQELLEILEKSASEIYIIDREDFSYLYVNEGAAKKLGYTKEELYSMNVFDLNPFLTKKEALRIRDRVLQTGNSVNRTVHRTKDGSLYHVQSYLQLIRYKAKDAFIIFDIDISSMVELEKKQKEQAKIVESIHDGVILTDLEGNIKNVNTAVGKILGRKDITHIQEVYDSSNKLTLKEIFQYIKKCDEECSKTEEVYFIHKNGKKIICELSLTQLRDENDHIYALVWLFQDISEKKEKERMLLMQALELEYQANHDVLTRLPNRSLFRDRLEQSIFYAKRNNKKFALLFIDLDRFKQINDSYGHQFGDQVLLNVVERLKNALRQEDTLARIGGDEFTVIAKDIGSKKDAQKVAKKILQSFKDPLEINGKHIYMSTSIGIAIYPDDTISMEDLIKYADSAMYEAKEEGRDTFKFYDTSMTQSAYEKVIMQNSLRSAIEEEEFDVYFQPQIDLITNEVTGIEALVRWSHPTLGTVPPGKFLSIAKESGLLTNIDRIVMKKALKIYSQWKKKNYNLGRISINLGLKQLLEKDFMQNLQKNLKKYDFSPMWLEFEVTEGDVMQDPARSIELLTELHDMGISISVDDFGTGYSSLSYLMKLPIDKLKIDRSFIVDITKDKSAKAIVNTIIVLAKSLGMDVVAEGVETKEECEFLKTKGCRKIQGYYFSKPRPAEEFEKYIQQLTIKS
ncbi:MAG: EAL domain-containing protein [Epsilonproteobacteria bacterium]|nr:EAL domain-containing protein [Campylobacterota bacterium]